MKANADDEYDQYCYEIYNEFREIRYWAMIDCYISDADFESQDSVILGLKNDSIKGTPNETIQSFFYTEFKKTLISNLPFYNADEGSWDRIKKCLGTPLNPPYFERYKECQRKENERREKIYGKNPASLFCKIIVRKRNDLVLMNIETSISTDQSLRKTDSLLSENDLYYAKTVDVENVIKNAISEQFESLAKKLHKIRMCPEVISPSKDKNIKKDVKKKKVTKETQR